MTKRQLYAGVMAGLFAIALPVAGAMAAGGGNGGTSGGSGGGGGASGGGAGGGEIGTLTISNDSDANADYQKAQTAINGADYKAAADLLQKVLARQPENPDVLNLMGFSERKMGEASTALMYYKKALGLQPNHIGANEYLGELYLELKQPDMAEQRLAVLQQVCGSCEEYTELKEKIEKFKANPS
jgi:tetratricopeptide (TPR) repeat protein